MIALVDLMERGKESWNEVESMDTVNERVAQSNERTERASERADEWKMASERYL